MGLHKSEAICVVFEHLSVCLLLREREFGSVSKPSEMSTQAAFQDITSMFEKRQKVGNLLWKSSKTTCVLQKRQSHNAMRQAQ